MVLGSEAARIKWWNSGVSRSIISILSARHLLEHFDLDNDTVISNFKDPFAVLGRE